MGMLYRIDPLFPDDDTVRTVASVLARGGVGVFPTDTVYGIGVAVLACADPGDIFRIKHRPAQKAIPWLVSGVDSLDRFGCDVPGYAHDLADAYWPGALTLVVTAGPAVPPAFRADDGTVALRQPASPLTLALIAQTASPLATSSANTSEQPAPRSASELEPRIIEEADVTVDGGTCAVGIASTVVVCTGDKPRIVREGAITFDMVNSIEETARTRRDRS